MPNRYRVTPFCKCGKVMRWITTSNGTHFECECGEKKIISNEAPIV